MGSLCRQAASVPSRSVSSSLLERLRVQEPVAWHRLVDLYGPLIYRWGRRSGLEGEQAKDITQEVLGTVAAKMGGFHRDRPGDSFRGWLWTITKNKIHDHFRARRRQPDAQGGTQAHEQLQQIPEPQQLSAADRQGDDEILSGRVCQLIRQEFEERTWRAFWRLTVDELPGLEVAAELGMTLPAVYQAKCRVLRRIREEFAEVLD
jgi:RNA polymerase sigma-70 factor (ECF subfamily)